MVLDACQAVRDAGIDKSRIRARIEHCSMLHDDQILPMKRLGVSVESAIRAMTSEAAWQLFADHEIGSLEPAKLADLVILDRDPRKVDPAAIRTIRVTETRMDGQRVFAA